MYPDVSIDLLDDAKNYLDMTWADSEADTKLDQILGRGMAYLEHTAGGSLDFSRYSTGRALLFDYCRYVLAGSLQDFAKDFQAELLGLHITSEVENYDPFERRSDHHFHRGKHRGEWGAAEGEADSEDETAVSAAYHWD